MPCTSLRLVSKLVCQRLMSKPALDQARTPDERRAHKRVTEANRVQIGVDNPCRGCGSDRVQIQGDSGDRARRFEGFANVVLVVQGGYEQDGASCFGKLKRTGGKRTLEALSQRKATRHRWLVVRNVRSRWELDECERISCRFL